MKKQICSLALCTIFGLGTAMATPIAQDQNAGSADSSTQPATQRRHADPNRQLQFLSKRLNLSEDQQKQILPLLTQQQQQMQEIFSDSTLNRKDRFQKVRSVRERTEASMKAVLNDQQRHQYDQMLQQRRQRMEQRREQRESANQNGGNAN
jgi:Spy/CpxP family protein refolding chaperone